MYMERERVRARRRRLNSLFTGSLIRLDEMKTMATREENKQPSKTQNRVSSFGVKQPTEI